MIIDQQQEQQRERREAMHANRFPERTSFSRCVSLPHSAISAIGGYARVLYSLFLASCFCAPLHLRPVPCGLSTPPEVLPVGELLRCTHHPTAKKECHTLENSSITEILWFSYFSQALNTLTLIFAYLLG